CTSCFQQPEIPSFEDQLNADIAAIDAHLAANNITAIQHESGLRYVVVEEGSGPKPTLANTVRVTYTGKLLSNGQVFDQRTQPIEFALQNLIVGWQIAFPLLNVGTQATLYIPSGYCYGRAGSDRIPPNAILIFDVELLAIVS
ncbi:MAG: FKBP-type peptidyl-prolyl cis-trans isomerase, partial [Cyclobacteriaceae bacterium]|nr:FKBP-type peptidyl-prolyl cis-trans isomerase [Cyclobacteriaceae bacterium]